MTTNKPEVVAWGVPNSRLTERQPFMQLLHTQEGTQYPELLDPLIRLSDYEALQAEVEVLRKENRRLKDGALEDLRLRTSALEMMNAANSKVEALLDALRQIAEWPDGGNRYGQRNIKRFAQSVIDTAMREEAGNDHCE